MIKHKGYAQKLAKFNLRYGRGNGHLGFVVNTFKMVVYFGGFAFLMKEWFNWTISKEIGIAFAFLYLIACYFVGWIDEKVGFWKQEARYSTKELNPFFEELDKKVDDILKKL